MNELTYNMINNIQLLIILISLFFIFTLINKSLTYYKYINKFYIII